jgi:hypothetical protein
MRSSNHDEAALPTPANRRKPVKTTATAYRGWLRNRMNFWMKAISTNRKARPRARK